MAPIISGQPAGSTPRAAFGNIADNDHAHQYAANPVPSIQDGEELWTSWDTVTKDLISSQELSSQPIKLRNPLVFYLGHIPTFLDIHLTRATGEALTEPKHYPPIFERGIDPDVDDPTLCHDHSEIPEEWPPLHEIDDYQGRVRDRVRFILTSSQADADPTVAHALWLGFEHEAIHLETFLYMLLQSDKTRPPSGVPMPNFKDEARHAAAYAVPNRWFRIPAQTMSIGLDEPEKDHLPRDSFGWDNEKPRRMIQTAAFEAQGRPITNGEYANYLEQTGAREIPASWLAMPNEQQNQNGVHENGCSNGTDTTASRLLSDHAVRTVFGPVPLRYAADWPVIASYDQLAQYAAWKNSRLPTFGEAQSIYSYSEHLERASIQAECRAAKGANASNGHRYQAEETRQAISSSQCPDHQPSLNTRPVYIDLRGCNVGFKKWHPTPVTPNGDRLCGQAAMGGVWEWTASPLQPHKGFKAMDVYPGYTADFFDGKHNIVLGGSWATHPRLAGRTTFISWYQRNYPFAWAGARLVRDI